MWDKLARLARGAVAVSFMGALGFGVSQALGASAATLCDTPPGTCTMSSDCDFPVCPHGGGCFGGPTDGCCVCFQ